MCTGVYLKKRGSFFEQFDNISLNLADQYWSGMFDHSTHESFGLNKMLLGTSNLLPDGFSVSLELIFSFKKSIKTFLFNESL